MSMTHVLLVRRVIQPGLLRVSSSSEGKEGKQADQSSECCSSDDMHLPSQKGILFDTGVGNGHANVQMRWDGRKLCSFRAEKCDVFV